MALVFYCLGFLDLSGGLEAKSKDWERESWREWIWSQQTREPISSISHMRHVVGQKLSSSLGGSYGTGFQPSSYMTTGVRIANCFRVEHD